MSRAGAPRSVPQRRQVLVVDDAEVIRTYLRNLLPTKGYEVLLAEDGARALELLASGARPDVVLLDVMMPQPDGIETLRRIKQRDPSLPVIMLSVVGKAGTVVEAMNLGAGDYTTNEIRGWLFKNTGAVVSGRATVLETWGYIACMPSLHIAQELVMLYYARRSSIALAISSVFTAITMVLMLLLS